MTTLEEIEALPQNMLTAANVAPYLECDPNLIRWQAHNEPEKLGFPVIVVGSRVKIPKIPFIKFMRGDILYMKQENTEL